MSSVCPPLAFVTLTIDIGHCSFSLLNIALPLAIVMIAVMERVNALPMHLFKQIPVQLNPHMHATISLLIYSLNCWAADSSPHYRSQHLPGRRNLWADALSRIAQPGSGAVIPAALLDAQRATPPVRDAAWWRADGDPLMFGSLA